MFITRMPFPLALKSMITVFLLQTADASQPKAVRMAGSPLLEDGSDSELLDKSSISFLDALMAIVIVWGTVWLFRRWRQRGEDSVPAPKSYSIQ